MNNESEQMVTDETGKYIRMYGDFTQPLNLCLEGIMQKSGGKVNPYQVRNRLKEIYALMR